jgi:cytochrome c-type biogenesis protein CcmF
MIQEKRGMLRLWNVSLVTLAFGLSLFGTFLTRSGILTSIHSFTQSSIGSWFLGFIVVVAAFSTALILWRLPLLRSKTRLESLVSREATFLYNNLLLVALCLTVLWGVVYPIVTEAFRGEAITVGRPYFDFFLRVFGLPLLLLMGIGPLVAWRRASLRQLGRTFLWPLAAALVAGAILLLLGAGSSPPGLAAYTFCVFVLAAIALEFARGTTARRSLSSESWGTALTSLVARNRRRYGGYVVHASIVFLALGIVGSEAYDTVREARLRPGGSMQVGGYTLLYERLVQREAPNAVELRALVDVSRGGERVGRLEPGKNRYPAEQQVSNEMAIHRDWLRGEDLDVIVDQIDADGGVYFKVLKKPLVNLLWVAGFVFLAGSLIALWPDAREERRLALRYGGREALARP